MLNKIYDEKTIAKISSACDLLCDAINECIHQKVAPQCNSHFDFFMVASNATLSAAIRMLKSLELSDEQICQILEAAITTIKEESPEGPPH